jgi:hypothetical protein
MLLYRLHYIIINYYYDYLIRGFIELGECDKELESLRLYSLIFISHDRYTLCEFWSVKGK